MLSCTPSREIIRKIPGVKYHVPSCQENKSRKTSKFKEQKGGRGARNAAWLAVCSPSMHEALGSSPDITNAEHDGACPEPQILEVEAGGSHVAVHSRRTGALEILFRESGRGEGKQDLTLYTRLKLQQLRCKRDMGSFSKFPFEVPRKSPGAS